MIGKKALSFMFVNVICLTFAIYTKSPTSSALPRVSISMIGPKTAQPGQTITYTITITNETPNINLPAPITVKDVAPFINSVNYIPASKIGSWKFDLFKNAIFSSLQGSLGGSTPAASFTLTCTLPANASGSITNKANINDLSKRVDPTSTLFAQLTTIVITNPLPRLSISDEGPKLANPGDTLVYTITVTNETPSIGLSVPVVVKDLPPLIGSMTFQPANREGLWKFLFFDNTFVAELQGNLDNGTPSASFTLSGVLPETALGSITNSANIKELTKQIDPASKIFANRKTGIMTQLKRN